MATSDAIDQLEVAYEVLQASASNRIVSRAEQLRRKIVSMFAEMKYLKEKIPVVLNAKYDEAKLKQKKVKLADYKNATTFTAGILKNLKDPSARARFDRVQKLNKWFVNLDKHVTEYNNLVADYVKWYKLTYKEEPPSTSMGLVSQNLADVIKMRKRLRNFKQNISSIELSNSEWFKNRNIVLKHALDLIAGYDTFRYRFSEAYITTMLAGFPRLRYNNIKTRLSDKFDVPLTYLVTMASLEICMYYNNLLIICEYTRRIIYPLVRSMEQCIKK